MASGCIAMGVQWLELYCNTTNCIAMGVQWLELYCNMRQCIVTQYTVYESLFGYCS